MPSVGNAEDGRQASEPRAQKADLIGQTQMLLAAEVHERRNGLAVPVRTVTRRPATLARQVRLGVIAALDQRIAMRYQLAPMDLALSSASRRPSRWNDACQAIRRMPPAFGRRRRVPPNRCRSF